MTNKDFTKFVRDWEKGVSSREMNLTTLLEGKGGVLDIEFLDAYAERLRYDLQATRRCITHIRGMIRENWLARLLTRGRLKRLEWRHRYLIGRLMLVGIYKRLYFPDPRLYD